MHEEQGVIQHQHVRGKNSAADFLEKAGAAGLGEFGLGAAFEVKAKTGESAVQSGFIKANTLEHFIKIGVPTPLQKQCHGEELLKIRLEIDIDPPGDFRLSSHSMLMPTSFSVQAFALPDLFAGKLHALLFREWRGRVKGRDWYDALWLLARAVPVHLKHLEARMRQSGNLYYPLTLEGLQELIVQKIAVLDVEAAKADIFPFLKDASVLASWNREFFQGAFARLTCQ